MSRPHSHAIGDRMALSLTPSLFPASHTQTSFTAQLSPGPGSCCSFSHPIMDPDFTAQNRIDMEMRRLHKRSFQTPRGVIEQQQNDSTTANQLYTKTICLGVPDHLFTASNGRPDFFHEVKSGEPGHFLHFWRNFPYLCDGVGVFNTEGGTRSFFILSEEGTGIFSTFARGRPVFLPLSKGEPGKIGDGLSQMVP